MYVQIYCYVSIFKVAVYYMDTSYIAFITNLTLNKYHTFLHVTVNNNDTFYTTTYTAPIAYKYMSIQVTVNYKHTTYTHTSHHIYFPHIQVAVNNKDTA